VHPFSLQNSDDGGSILLRNVHNDIPDYTESHSRRQQIFTLLHVPAVLCRTVFESSSLYVQQRFPARIKIAFIRKYVNHRRVCRGVNLTHSLTHAAEPFLRSCQLCSYSRTSQHFMEPGGSSKPSTGPYPEPDRSNPHHPILPL
jgi:hypothetical protein